MDGKICNNPYGIDSLDYVKQLEEENKKIMKEGEKNGSRTEKK